MFLPLLGSGIYLCHHLYSRDNIAVIQESVKGAINSNYRIEQLEKQVEFSNSVMNRINLADAYVEYERYENALALYESCLLNFNAGSAELAMKLVNCYHYTNQHQKAVDYGIKIENEKVFKKSVERIAFGWSLYHVKDYERAERNFKAMNSRYSNYPHRLEYSKFSERIGSNGGFQGSIRRYAL